MSLGINKPNSYDLVLINPFSLKVTTPAMSRVPPAKPKNDSFLKADKKENAFLDVLSEYTAETSIHGMKYLGKGRGKCVVRIFWIMALVLSVSGCAYLIFRTYQKWQSNPVIVSFDENSIPVSTIPFPAVTICPGAMFKKNIFNLTKIKPGEAYTEEQTTYQNALYAVCPFIEPIPSDNKINFEYELRKLAIPFNEVFHECYWRGVKIKCSEKFHEVRTDEGVCYTFNMLDHKALLKDIVDDTLKYPKSDKKSTNWSLQGGYSTNDADLYPERALGSGFQAGLRVILVALKPDLDYNCKGPVQGFKLSLHSPTDIPRFSKQFYRIPLRREVLLSVTPDVVKTANGLQYYSPLTRQCYYNGEKTLKYFKVYTQSNCELECLTNYTLNTCSCTKYAMPFENSTEICGWKKQKCYAEVEARWIIETWNEYLQDQSLNDQTKCNCLPACTSIEYSADVSQGDLYFTEYQEYLKNRTSHFDQTTNAYGKGDYKTSVQIYFKDNNFIALKRSELYGLTDFLSNCGGLLGLFMVRSWCSNY